MNAPDLSRLKIDRSAGATRRSRKPGKKLLWGALVLVLLAGGAAWRYFKAPMTVESVTVTTAFPYQGVTLMNATGYVAAQRKASLASKATGRLVWLGVLEGSKVKEGEVVARLESNDVAATEDQAAANVRQARANLEQGQAELVDAEANLRRTQDLVEKKFQSASVLDQAIARYRKAKSGISSMQAAIGVAQASERGAKVGVEQTLIRAPFDGVVLTKAANIGDVITPFSNAADSKGAVVTIADMSTLEVEADVSESNIGKVKVGTPCEIQLDAFPDQRFQGNVSRMVPTVDRSKASVMVKIRFKNLDPRILPDMSAKVAFLEREMNPERRAPLTVVNPQAVVERDGAKVVFVLDGEHVRQASVALGEKIGDSMVVTGLKAGDKVVIKPAERLRDGAAVKPGGKVNAPGLGAGPIISIRHVVKNYIRGGQTVKVLEGITLDIARGEFVALMGPSGSGKSTLLNLIAGIDKPTSGELLIDGEDITKFDQSELAHWRAQKVGFIFQFYNLMPVLTALENVELPLLLTDLPRRERRERAALALEMVNLADRMDHTPNELSGGQQQRVAIARAVITDPTILVADEPTGDLDRTSAEEVLRMLQRLNRELGATIVMVTHDARAAGAAQAIMHLEKGVLESREETVQIKH